VNGWSILIWILVFAALMGSWRLIGRADRWSQRRGGKDTSRPPGQRPTPPRWVMQYGWALCLVGAVLLGVGIALHSSPSEYGGPISLGVILMFGGVVGLVRKRRGDVP